MDLIEGLFLLDRFKFTRFNAQDDDTYGGAELFEDGTPPFISDLSNGNIGFVTIIDRVGMEINFAEDINILGSCTNEIVCRVNGDLVHCLKWLEITNLLQLQNVETIRFIMENFAIEI